MYLSSNQPVQKYSETDAEALLMAVSTYAQLVANKQHHIAKNHLKDCITNGQQGISATMSNTESRAYVLNLFKLQHYMGHTPAFTSKWIREHLFGVYGGVSLSKNI
jgi:hypothetical protein